MAVYLGDFECKADVIEKFSLKLDDLKQCKILLAWYGYGDYDGSAFVLFERDGKLYEVNGGHCSCYGLEGQWEPEVISVEQLMHRIDNGHLGRECYYNEGVFDSKLKGILNRWKRRQHR
jgi:hypothetical protein